MKKLLILALASAFSVVATAATGSWFEGRANGTAYNASWSSPQPSGVTFTGSVIDLDLDAGDELELTPRDNTAPDTNTVTVVNISNAVFTPCAYDSIDADLTNGVQTALTVAYKNGETNYYAHSNGEWVQLAGVPSSEPVSVVIKMNYYESSVTATFKIGNGEEQTKPVGTSSRSVNSVSLAGNGKVASLATEVELGVAEDSSRKYPTLAEAVAGGSSPITLLRDTNEDITLSQGVAFNTNGKNYTGSVSPASGADIQSDSGTYTAIQQYFPRTGTSGQDGSQANPYEIKDFDDLQALAAAVANTNVQGKTYATYNYVLIDDITLEGQWPGIGIQNGKDKVASPEYDNGAFQGTFDGDNHTISGFQMVGGNLDYCGLFNSTYRAVVKNLKIQYKGTNYAADTSESTEESGATFVGVAKQTRLENLTSLPAQGETSVFCGKGIGGIVGYLNDGSSVDSCTNTVALTSYSNKAGGIAMIRQNGDSCTINNCKNTGMVSSLSSDSGKKVQFGAIVGYVDHGIVISNCENTASCKMFHNNSGEFTVGGVNKGPASVVAYSGGAVDGFTYATVSGDVATFVKKFDLAAGNTYLLTGDVGSGTVFTLSSKGAWIAFDSSLDECTFGGNVAAGNGLVAHKAESGNVITYTAYGDAEVAEDAAETAAKGIGISDDEAKAALKTDMKDWIASGAVTAAELDANPTNVMNRARDTGNKLTLLQSYVLNLNATNANATVKAELPAGGTQTEGTGAETKILIKVPVTPRANTGYTVEYQVMRKSDNDWVPVGDAQTNPNEIKIPVGTGRYRVDAVLKKN